MKYEKANGTMDARRNYLSVDSERPRGCKLVYSATEEPTQGSLSRRYAPAGDFPGRRNRSGSPSFLCAVRNARDQGLRPASTWDGPHGWRGGSDFVAFARRRDVRRLSSVHAPGGSDQKLRAVPGRFQGSSSERHRRANQMELVAQAGLQSFERRGIHIFGKDLHCPAASLGYLILELNNEI